MYYLAQFRWGNYRNMGLLGVYDNILKRFTVILTGVSIEGVELSELHLMTDKAWGEAIADERKLSI